MQQRCGVRDRDEDRYDERVETATMIGAVAERAMMVGGECDGASNMDDDGNGVVAAVVMQMAMETVTVMERKSRDGKKVIRTGIVGMTDTEMGAAIMMETGSGVAAVIGVMAVNVMATVSVTETVMVVVVAVMAVVTGTPVVATATLMMMVVVCGYEKESECGKDSERVGGSDRNKGNGGSSSRHADSGRDGENECGGDRDDGRGSNGDGDIGAVAERCRQE